TFGVLVEQLPVETRLVVVTLEERIGRGLDEVLIALRCLRQHCEVVVELLALVAAFTATIIDLAAAHWSFMATVARHVGLDANYRVDAFVVARLVEVENAVHVAMVGDTDGRL